MSEHKDSTAQESEGISPQDISYSEFIDGYYETRRQIVPVTEGITQKTELKGIDELEESVDSVYKEFFIIESMYREVLKDEKERRIPNLMNIGKRYKKSLELFSFVNQFENPMIKLFLLNKAGAFDNGNHRNELKKILNENDRIFWNLSFCQEIGYKKGVEMSKDIINSETPIDSYEYMNLYILIPLRDFDGKAFGRKIVRDLQRRETLTEKEARHFKKQIMFQYKKNKESTKKQSGVCGPIEEGDCGKIMELIGEKEFKG